MARTGRPSQVNWTPSKNAFTATIRGVRHRLGTDREEAEKKFRFLLAQDGQGQVELAANPLIADLAEAWLEHAQVTMSPDRYRLCSARWSEFIQFVGVGVRLDDLKPVHVDTWIASKPTVTKPGTVRLYKSMILAALNWCALTKNRGGGGMIGHNPLKGQVALPTGGSRGGEAVWNTDIYTQVLENANPAFGDVVRILRWTGCRPNLVCKVEARHYNPTTKTWDVADLYESGSKKGVKRVWLPEQARELVLAQNVKHPDGPIFLNANGGPWNSDALQIYLYNMMTKFKDTKNLDFPKGLCIYGLRHTFATDFIKRFPDKLEYLRVLLGHKDLQMIRQHYGHLFDEHKAVHDVLDMLDMPA